METKQLKINFLSRLDQYLFSTTRFHNLGLIRIIIAALCVHQSYKNYGMMSKLTFINPDINALHEPGILVKFFNVPFPLSVEYSTIFALFYYIVGFFAIVGIFTRVSLIAFSLATIYILDIINSRGFYNHETSLSTQVLLILALAPGSTSFSIDKAFSWFAKSGKLNLQFLKYQLGNPVPVWGVKLLLILLAATYFTAGYSKVRYGGLQWVDGETLTHLLDGSGSTRVKGKTPPFIGPPDVPAEDKWRDGFGITSYSFGNMQTKPFPLKVSKFLVENKIFMVALAVGTLILELGSFIVFFGGWYRLLYLLAAIMMHKSIGFLMDLPFINYQALCLLLIDWKWVYEKIKIRLTKFTPVLAKVKAPAG